MDKKIKVIIDDIEVEVKISEEELAKLTNAKEPKKTGYERAIHGEYYVMTGDSKVLCESDVRAPYDDSAYESANYYTDKTLAENNARADKLLRQLRRFSAENCEEVPWDNEHAHYGIYYDYIGKGLNSHRMLYIRDFGEIYFGTEENAPKELIEKESINVASRLQTIKEELSCTATTLASLERFVFGKTATPDECIKEPECLMDELGLIAYYTSKVADYSKALSSLLGAY